MENKLSAEQMHEVNARVKEIIETFREGLCNSSVFDYQGYWLEGLNGNGHMSDACKHVYDTKSRIVSMIDKEMQLVFNWNEEIYYKKKREAKQEIIGKIEKMIFPYLRGNSHNYHIVTERAVKLAEFAIESGENLNEFCHRGRIYSRNDFFRK